MVVSISIDKAVDEILLMTYNGITRVDAEMFLVNTLSINDAVATALATMLGKNAEEASKIYREVLVRTL